MSQIVHPSPTPSGGLFENLTFALSGHPQSPPIMHQHVCAAPHNGRSEAKGWLEVRAVHAVRVFWCVWGLLDLDVVAAWRWRGHYAPPTCPPVSLWLKLARSPTPFTLAGGGGGNWNQYSPWWGGWSGMGRRAGGLREEGGWWEGSALTDGWLKGADQLPWWITFWGFQKWDGSVLLKDSKTGGGGRGGGGVGEPIPLHRAGM